MWVCFSSGVMQTKNLLIEEILWISPKSILNSKTLYKLTAVKAIIDEYREAAREIMKKR